MSNKYPIGGYAPGNYSCTCCKCGTEFSGDKRAVECEQCAVSAKAKFDALSPEQQQATLGRNVIIANWMFETPLTPERDLILRIVSQWGNAVEMPNMEQWLKDYAAKAQPGPRWVKCSDRLPGYKMRVKWRDGNDHSYATEGVISLFEMDKPNLEGWEWLDEQPALKQIDREWICDALIEFTIAYIKSNNKDIANDAAEYLDDKLKEAGIMYVLSEDEQPAVGREEDAV